MKTANLDKIFGWRLSREFDEAKRQAKNPLTDDDKKKGTNNFDRLVDGHKVFMDFLTQRYWAFFFLQFLYLPNLKNIYILCLISASQFSYQKITF